MATNPLLQSMQSLVGPLPKFKYIDDKYKCEICKNVLQVPMMTHCGHRMCHSCASKYLEERGGKAKCPAKQDDCFEFTMDSLVPDPGTFRDLQKVDVFCPNSPHGCPEHVPWGKLKDHVKHCLYVLEPCINKGFGCKAMVPKLNMSKHLKHECNFQTTECQHCNVRVLKKLLEEHMQNSCPNISIICPFKCGEQSIQRKDLDDHKKVCQAKPDDCKFRDIGCDFMGSEEEVRRHESSDSATHIEKMHNRIIVLQQENTQLKATVQLLQERPQMTGTPGQLPDMSDFEKRCKILESKQEKQESILKSTQKMVAKINEQVETGLSNSSNPRELTDLRATVRTVENSLEKAKTTSEEARQQLVQMERTVGLCNMRIQEMDLRLQCVETANHEGVLIWKIRDYKRRKQEAVSGRTVSLYSQPFYTSRYGYKACARIYLNGDGMGKGTHMSLFFVILRGDFDALLTWPFRQKVTMTLIDQEGGKKNIIDSFRADPTSNSFKKPTTDMNIASGCPLFAMQSAVEASPFLKDDCIFLKIQVDLTDLKDASYDQKSGSMGSGENCSCLVFILSD